VATRKAPTFGELLRHHRIAAGLTQDELAQRAGLSARAVSDLERGLHRAPHRDTMRRLADALGLCGPQRSVLLAGRLPRTKPVERGQPAPGGEPTLPTPLTSFIGRERAVEEVKLLLSRGRLLTLIGSGGVGKTRLAVSVARAWLTGGGEAGTFVAFADLTPLADADLVPQTVAAQLGVPEQPGRSVLATLIDALEGQAGLLVLDNCEHLVEACAVLANELLTACPELRILATSREALRIAGETVWRVPSLELPESSQALEQITSSEAVRLFVDRARAVLPTFELNSATIGAVTEVCRRLDGIPLALELAAARVSLLSIEQIAARLDDALGLLVAGRRLAPARQQTVRATLDWSYALLTESERMLFERLAVFVGGCTLEAAEAVAGGDGLAPREVLALLGRLVYTSMVVVEPAPDGHTRYRLLEALRQYGRERLTESGSADDIHRQHAAYFLALAEQIEPDLSNPRVMAAQARLEADHDNFRTALGWFVDQADIERAQRLAGALGRFWFFRGHLAEADVWLSRLLAVGVGDRPTAGRAKCLYGAGMLAIGRSDYLAVESLSEQGRGLWHALGNAAQEAFCLFTLGQATMRLGKYAAARPHLEAGLALSRAASHGGAEANCLVSLAELAAELGHDDEASRWAEAALVRATEIGQERQIAVARRMLGVLSLRRGEYPGAAGWLEGSLTTWRKLGELWWVAQTLVSLAQLAIACGEIGTARTHLTESLRLAQELGDRLRTAEGLEGFVQVAVLEGRPRLALQLGAAAEAVRESIRVPQPPAGRSHLERYLGRARSALGGQAAERASVAGQALGMRHAIDLALSGTALSTVDRPARRGRAVLTAREQGVARLVAQGLTNRQIAERLVIAGGTAERHVGNILGKLEMNARTQIAAWAVAHGLVPSEIPTEV
jgi:predicted ATPase/DNA-binding CsgD family transcriptional regulator